MVILFSLGRSAARRWGAEGRSFGSGAAAEPAIAAGVAGGAHLLQGGRLPPLAGVDYTQLQRADGARGAPAVAALLLPTVTPESLPKREDTR